MSKRKLKDSLGEVESKKDGLPDRTTENFAKQWLESIKYHPKASTYRGRQVSVNQLHPFYKGPKLAEIPYLMIEKMDQGSRLHFGSDLQPGPRDAAYDFCLLDDYLKQPPDHQSPKGQ